MSFVESVANVVIGSIVTMGEMAVLPWFDVRLSLSENLLVGGIFTAVSIVRSYTLRRSLSEALRTCRNMKDGEPPVTRI